MAGRGGGGRGRGGAGGGGYFNALKDNLNIAKGEKLISSLTPPPLFPPLAFKPVPLRSGDDEDYAQRLKQALRHSFRDSEYVVMPVTIKDNAPTYSDTCQSSKAASDAQQWVPDWTSLPKELYQFQHKRRATSKKTSVCPKKVKRNVAKVDVEKTLLELENKESKDENVVDEEKKEDESEDEENEEGEILDEEEIEEGTDYNMSYFDNGEDYLDDEEDNLDDGPVY